MSTADPVVISGIGTLGASGLGPAALLRDLRKGGVTLTEVDRSEGFHAGDSATRAALVGKFSMADWIPPLVARRLSPPSRFAVVAAREALSAAGIELPEEPSASTGLAIASAFGPSTSTKKLLDQILHENPAAASPAQFTECVANAPAGHVSLHCRAAGPAYTLSNREAGPLLALARGASEISNGRADVVLAGSVDEMTPLLHAILDRFRALARRDARGDERARPFDRRRDGFIAAEGATMLVLERESAARRRGATPLARIRSWARAFDASTTPCGWGRGVETMAAGSRRCLQRAGLGPADVDLIVSGASGARQGDWIEAKTLASVWHDRERPPVVVPKSMTGEYGGGFLAAAVLAAAGEEVGGTSGFEEADPELGLIPHRGASTGDARRVLASSLAAGGAAAWVLLERT